MNYTIIHYEIIHHFQVPWSNLKVLRKNHKVWHGILNGGNGSLQVSNQYGRETSHMFFFDWNDIWSIPDATQ